MADRCYAPVFKPSTPWRCIVQAILAALLLPLLLLAWLLSLGNPAVLCEIRRLVFRTRNCRRGNSDPQLDLNADAYTRRVREYRSLYGKDGAWEQWMEDNRSRYIGAFNTASAAPAPIRLAFRYDTTPIAYSPPWATESEHMAALEALMEPAYHGYDFQLLFNADPATTYGAVVAGIPTNASHASGRTVYLYYETIINHEFAHVLGLWHHYDSTDTVGDGLHMPPGDSTCIMDRNSSQFCSGCRTALGIPLGVDNAAAITSAFYVIRDRIPY
jgi:hypothetical protein